MKSLFSRRRADPALLEEQQRVLDRLFETRDKLDTIWNCFQNTCDPDLIEACIFEINAVSAQYSFLLRRARKLDASNPPTFLQPHTAALSH